MINIFKGILVGIFNIAPGLSGSALLISFGLYDKCISAISNIFKNPKKTFIFLFPIAIGIITGTYLFSNLILYFLNNYPKKTYIVFAFLLLTAVPSLFKEATKKGYKNIYLIPFVISFLIGILLLLYNPKDSNIIINYNFFSFIKFISIGVILSFSTIVPGISSTALLSMLGLYKIYIYSISNINFFILIPVFIGFIITSFIISKIINYLIKNYYGYTYFSILGFALSAIPFMLRKGL